MSERETITSLRQQVNEFRLSEAALAQLETLLSASFEAPLRPQELAAFASMVAGEAARALGALHGAFFLAERGTARLIAVFGSEMPAATVRFAPGEGLTGQAIQAQELLLFDNIPLPVGSSLGKVTANCYLAVSPLLFGGELYGVIELASIDPFQPFEIQLLEKMSRKVAFFLHLRRQFQQVQEAHRTQEAGLSPQNARESAATQADRSQVVVEMVAGQPLAPPENLARYQELNVQNRELQVKAADLQEKLNVAHRIIRNYEQERQGQPELFSFEDIFAQAMASATASYEEQLAVAKDELSAAQQEIMGLTEQLGAFTAQLTAEAQTAQAASLKADGLARAMVTAQANLASIEQKLAEVQVALTEGRVREAGLSGQLLKVEAERSELAEQLRQTELARQVAELAAESAGRETSEANSTRQTLVLENKALGEQFVIAQQASTALEFSLGEMQRSMASQTADLATQLANAQAQVATLQDASGNAHQDLELEIADLQNQLASVHQQVLSLTAELAETIRALDDRLAQANKMEQQHSAQATVEMTEVMAQLANADTKYQAQQMAIEQLTNIAQDYEAQLKQAHQAMLAKQRDLEMMTEKLAGKETLPTKTEQFQAEMAASLEAVREMLLRKEEELLALRQSKSANGSTTANQRAELARWEQAVTGLVAELQAKDSQLGTLGHALADRDRTLADATGLASEYSYQLNLAREEIRRLRAEVEDLSRELSRR